MPIDLPADPIGEQFEDLVIAALQSLGYFVEPRLILRDGNKEVLELDVVATPLGGAQNDRILFEAKKERFKFENVFKLFGQRTYLRINSAALVSMRGADPDYLPVYEAKGAELGVAMCCVPAKVAEAVKVAPRHNTLSADQVAAIAEVGCFAHIGRRVANGALSSALKARKGAAIADAARSYVFNTRASFFEPDPLRRAEIMYSAYQAAPGIAGKCVAALAGEVNATEDEVWQAVRDSEAHLWIQGIMDIENHARIAIIKNAFDDYVERGAAPLPTTPLNLGKLSFDVPIHQLPVSFRQGLQALGAHPHSAKIPYLMQVFYSLLGGVVFFNDADELALVKKLTGVPAAEVVSCIRLLDTFFPTSTSLFFTAKNELMALKMVPGFVRGAGAFFRKRVFDLQSYSQRYPAMGWLVGKWHNALYLTLEPELAVTP